MCTWSWDQFFPDCCMLSPLRLKYTYETPSWTSQKECWPQWVVKKTPNPRNSYSVPHPKESYGAGPAACSHPRLVCQCLMAQAPHPALSRALVSRSVCLGEIFKRALSIHHTPSWAVRAAPSPSLGIASEKRQEAAAYRGRGWSGPKAVYFPMGEEHDKWREISATWLRCVNSVLATPEMNPVYSGASYFLQWQKQICVV